MHYPPAHHQESNFENIIALMKLYPLATIITTKNETILSTHIPLVYQANNGLGRLIGHLDKYNPQIDHFGSSEKVELIFNGPQVYISPSVYGTTQLPTWNYFKAHLKGRIQIENDQEKVKQSLINMTAFLEGDNPSYTLESNNPRMVAALDYIVGFTIEIDSWEGKYKISQDKSKDDQLRAKKAMQMATQKAEEAIELLYSLHQTKNKFLQYPSG